MDVAYVDDCSKVRGRGVGRGMTHLCSRQISSDCTNCSGVDASIARIRSGRPSKDLRLHRRGIGLSFSVSSTAPAAAAPLGATSASLGVLRQHVRDLAPCALCKRLAASAPSSTLPTRALFAAARAARCRSRPFGGHGGCPARVRWLRRFGVSGRVRVRFGPAGPALRSLARGWLIGSPVFLAFPLSLSLCLTFAFGLGHGHLAAFALIPLCLAFTLVLSLCFRHRGRDRDRLSPLPGLQHRPRVFRDALGCGGVDGGGGTPSELGRRGVGPVLAALALGPVCAQMVQERRRLDLSRGR